METPEYSAEYFDGDSTYVISVDKVGGGTIGKAYVGEWLVNVTVKETGDILHTDYPVYTGMPKFHESVAYMVFDYLCDTDNR